MENLIKDAIKVPLEEINIELLDVHFGKEDGVETLFVTIDSATGVDTNLCEKAMKLISPIIDGLELSVNEYVLDVGSKGEQK